MDECCHWGHWVILNRKGNLLIWGVGAALHISFHAGKMSGF